MRQELHLSGKEKYIQNVPRLGITYLMSGIKLKIWLMHELHISNHRKIASKCAWYRGHKKRLTVFEKVLDWLNVMSNYLVWRLLSLENDGSIYLVW